MKAMRRIRIGTRGSKLALVQADRVKAELLERFPGLEIERVIIKTRGDKILDIPLARIGGKGLFIKEIEEALLQDEIDLAVHSLKDLPTSLPGRLILRAVLEREDPRDALVSLHGKSLEALSALDRIATSSLRRRSQLLVRDRSLRVIDIRGNIDTRLRKMEEGYCEALILAACGLKRVGLAGRITQYLEPEIMLPAVCQGIIGLETRREDEAVERMVSQINHPPTFLAAEAERAFLNTLEGGCQVPVACRTFVEKERVTIAGLIADPEGRTVIRKTTEGKPAAAARLARELAGSILKEGGAEILESIRE